MLKNLCKSVLICGQKRLKPQMVFQTTDYHRFAQIKSQGLGLVIDDY